MSLTTSKHTIAHFISQLEHVLRQGVLLTMLPVPMILALISVLVMRHVLHSIEISPLARHKLTLLDVLVQK